MINLSQCVNRFNTLKDRLHMAQHQHISFRDRETIIYGCPQNKIYIPTATGQFFHDDRSFVKLIMGPYGSGKSTLCINEIVRTASAMPRWNNGRRRARWAIVRNTSGELHSTTLQTWLTWFGELGDITKRQKPILTYEHTYNDGDGIVELELIFIALDRPDDVRKIKSLELTGVYLNELSELPFNVLSHFKGRVNGRYPSKSFCPHPYWSGIIADTNPCDTSHWIHDDFFLKKVDSYTLFRQPPGLLNVDGLWTRNPNADNADHLSNDYYEKLAEGQTLDFIKVYCLGDWGLVSHGKLVFPEFNSDLHIVDKIEAIQGEPIHLGFDGGLTPACVVVQMNERGRLGVLKEYVAEDMGIRTFVESVVIPGLARDFPYNPIGESVFDPAGGSRDTILEETSCIGEVNSLGIKTVAAQTNDLDPRLGAVRFFLNRMVDGKPSFAISRINCPVLCKGFMQDYIYKQLAVPGERRYKEKPDKNKASHPMDALQYIVLQFASDRIMLERQPAVKVDMNNPVLRIFT
jgi:hypothetical protein